MHMTEYEAEVNMVAHQFYGCGSWTWEESMQNATHLILREAQCAAALMPMCGTGNTGWFPHMTVVHYRAILDASDAKYDYETGRTITEGALEYIRNIRNIKNDYIVSMGIDPDEVSRS